MEIFIYILIGFLAIATPLSWWIMVSASRSFEGDGLVVQNNVGSYAGSYE